MTSTIGTLGTVSTAANSVSQSDRPTGVKPQPYAPPDPGTYHLFECRGDKMLVEQNESNDRHVLMTEAQAFQAVDHLVQRSGKRRSLQITFFGGEPTLNFDLINKVVAYCNEEAAPATTRASSSS